MLRQRTQIFSQLLGGDNKKPLGFIKTPKKQNNQIEDILVFFAFVMGCGASNSRLNKGVTVESQESLLSTVNNTDEARDMLAKIRILNPVQRRRSRSVGLPEENGVYWVYWRPERAQGRDLRANTEKEDLWPEVLEKQPTRSRNS